MKLRATIPAEELLGAQPFRKYLKRLLKLNLNWLARIFGSAVFLELPESLQNLDPQCYRVMEVAAQLKKMGILKSLNQIQKIPDEPFAYSYFTQSLEITATGTDFMSNEKALWKNVAETAERYLWRNSHDFFEGKIVKASYRRLKHQALDIFSLAGFSENQKKDSKIIGFSEKTPFGWIKARSPISGKKIFCPLQLISADYFEKNVTTPEKKENREPMLRWGITTGLATGQSLDESIAKGVLETIERDAFMITFLNKLSPPILDLNNLAEQDGEIKKIIDNFKRYKLDITVLNLPNDFSVNAILALVTDETGLGPAFSAGASADFDLKTALLDALSESLMVRYNQKNILNDYSESKVSKLGGRAKKSLYWSDPANLPKLDFLFQGKKETVQSYLGMIGHGNCWNLKMKVEELVKCFPVVE